MSANTDLMRAVGVPKGEFSPMPPKHHRFYIGDGETARNRLMAWIWEHTITLGHPTDGYGPRSPFCVGKDGKPLTIDDAATYFKWDDAFARKTLRQIVAQGRVRSDKKRRIWIIGEVRESIPLAEEPDETHQGESKANKKVCTRFLPGYILQKLKDWPEDKRKQFEAEEGRAADLREMYAADAIALCRAAADQDQNERLQRWGLPALRKIQTEKSAKPRAVKLELLVPENLVQSVPGPGTVPTESAHPVQSIPPYIPSELKAESEAAAVTVHPETAESAAAANLEFLRNELHARGLPIAAKFGKKLLSQLGDAPLLMFLSTVDRRRKGSAFSTGLLPKLAEDTRLNFTPEKAKPTEPGEAVCANCSGTGLVGGESWETEAEIRLTTAPACDCSMGKFVQMVREEQQAIA